jgi:hypothetical protein
MGSEMGAKLSALRIGSALSPGKFMVLISVRDCLDPKGHKLIKIAVTSSGVEVATIQLVA